ncbi:MAG: hypothetical protein R2699_19480 [Acidimicrobiales bacterium]
MAEVPVIDAWVNIFPEAFAAQWAAKDEQQGGPALRPSGPTVEGLLASMDEAGIQTGILTAGLSDPERAHRRGGYAAEDFLAIADEHPRALPGVGGGRQGRQADRQRAWRLRELFEHPAFALAR